MNEQEFIASNDGDVYELPEVEATTIVKCDTCGCTTDLTEFEEMNHWRDCPRLMDDPNGDWSGASDGDR